MPESTRYYHLDQLRRADLGQWEGAAGAVDDWLFREHGLTSSNHAVGHLFGLLADAGYTVTPVATEPSDPKALAEIRRLVAADPLGYQPARDDLAAVLTALDAVTAERDRLAAQVDAIRRIHRPSDRRIFNDEQFCQACTTTVDTTTQYVLYPCRNVRALDMQEADRD